MTIEMTIDDLYWMFSTIAQTLGAIVGIIGMLSVYKLQLLSNSMNNLLVRSEGFLKYHFGADSVGMSPMIFLEKCKELKKDNSKSQSDKSRFDNLESQIKKSCDFYNAIKSKIPGFFISNALIIFLSISAIPFCKFLIPWGEYVVVMTLLLLVLFAIMPTMFLCKFLISESQFNYTK